MAGMLQQVHCVSLLLSPPIFHFVYDPCSNRRPISSTSIASITGLSYTALLTIAHVCLQYGYTLLPDEQRQAADLWLINTCTVKSPSQTAMDNIISSGRQLGKKLIVAGCVPQGALLCWTVCLQPVTALDAVNNNGDSLN